MVWRTVVRVSVLAVVLGGCGSSSDGGGKAANGVSAASCHAQCDAQSAVTGCTPFVDLATCKSLCDAIASATPASCAGKFDAYYGCSSQAGFECSGTLVAQKGGACSTEQQDLSKCQNGGKKPTCEGANDAGFCPSVACPCPSGTTSVSGFSNASGTCKCFDTTTCLDMC
jgi:hypothetical protein